MEALSDPLETLVDWISVNDPLKTNKDRLLDVAKGNGPDANQLRQERARRQAHARR